MQKHNAKPTENGQLNGNWGYTGAGAGSFVRPSKEVMNRVMRPLLGLLCR